jgi:signal peptidase II
VWSGAAADAIGTSTFFRKGALLFLGTTLVVIALDQWTKSLAREHLLGIDGSGPRSIPLVGEYIRLTYVQNRGAAFGLLQDQTTFFVLVGVVVIVVIIASYRQLKEPGWLLNLCLGLQMGGALGNLVDRVRYGYVVDFFDLTFWPVFNVADSAICVGVALLAWKLLFPDANAQRAADA